MHLDQVIQLINVMILIEVLRLLHAQVGDRAVEAVIQQPLYLGVDLAGDIRGVSQRGEAPLMDTDLEKDSTLLVAVKLINAEKIIY